MQFKNSDKVWIYTSATKLTPTQQEVINNKSQKFIADWVSHGEQVIGKIEVLYNRFVVVISDDCGGHMCGTAKDAQVRLMKELEAELGISLLDRMQLGYKDADGNVTAVPMAEFQKQISQGTITADTIVFNNMVTDFGTYSQAWEVPLKESWHKQLL